MQSNDHETFHAMIGEQRQHLFEICKEAVDEIWETKSDVTTDLLNRFFTILRAKTALAVKEQLLTETFEDMYEDEVDFSERLPPEEVILQMLRAKVGEFETLIDILHERVLEYFSTQKPDAQKDDVEMEESKDEPGKLHTKLEPSTHP